MLATMIWGMGFVATRWTLADYTPIWSNGLRFAFAGAIALPILLYRRRIRSYKGIIISSFLLLIGLLLQTYGLKLTTLAKSGFLTAFYALFTPMISLLLYRSRFRPTYWALVVLAMFGIAMLCDLHWEGFNLGDAYTLASALFFSLHILAVDRYSRTESAFDYNLGQCVGVGILGCLYGFIAEGPPDLTPLVTAKALIYPSALHGFIMVSIFSSLIAFTIQIYAQQRTRAHIVSLIFLLESVFCAIFGYFFFQETLSWLGISGAALVLVAVGLTPLLTDFEKQES